MTFPKPPIAPMLAKLSNDMPAGEGWLFEPKWDGFRALVFKNGDELFIQSRDLKPLNRYFPELERAFREILPERCILDGEIVIATENRLDFEALLIRIHPAKSRVDMLAAEKPASFVAWDLLWIGDEDLRALGQVERRTRLEQELGKKEPPFYVTPATYDRDVATDWFHRFEGAGLDGVIAKPLDLTYQPNKRAMLKIKHARTCDCVVAGFRWYKDGENELVGSLLLGLYDDEKKLQHVGICASFKREERKRLTGELAPLREGAKEAHPWAAWAGPAEGGNQRMPGATSRWNRGKDLSWVPLRLERVVEVGFDNMQGTRFRHATHLKHWRPDKAPADCTYEQLEVTPPLELGKIFSGSES